jgi:2-oxo-3-hexenedioate decarboxylase/2-keto-4-pentenoate hydratase
MDAAAVERAAALIRGARTTRTPLEALPDDVRPRDEADAYAVQDALNRRLTVAGAGPTAGHKIGCTTPVMQAYLGIPNPCAGEVFARTLFRGRGRFVLAEHLRLGVECELAVELAADLASGPFTRDAVAAAVGAVAASIEVVDDRYRDYPTLGTPTLIADDFFNAGEVLGEPLREWRRLDLAGLSGRMLINGDVVGEGRGADILGHPLDALAWLAGARHARGRPLRAGEFVTLGSLVATRWVASGDEVRIELEGLAPATASFV